MHPKVLAVETATEACSAALLIHNEVIVRFQHAPRQHTQLALPMLEAVLKEGGITLTDVDAIAFGCGPGAFTGLRIAAGIAQGLALSVDIPVVPVSTLAALAQHMVHQSVSSQRGQGIIASLDARMQEVYWGEYRRNSSGLVELIGEEQLGSPEKMLANTLDETQKIAIGSGWDVYASELFDKAYPDNLHIENGILPSAEYIAKLALPLFEQGKAVAAEDAQPVYIRNNVAKKSAYPDAV